MNVTARRDENGGIHTNIKQTVVEHSPAGFNWGYGGSGPADFALNIIEAYLKKMGYNGRRVQAFKGKCFDLSFDLHQDFKWQFLSTVESDYIEIDGETITKWIKDNARKHGVEL